MKTQHTTYSIRDLKKEKKEKKGPNSIVLRVLLRKVHGPCLLLAYINQSRHALLWSNGALSPCS